MGQNCPAPLAYETLAVVKELYFICWIFLTKKLWGKLFIALRNFQVKRMTFSIVEETLTLYNLLY